MYDYNQKQFDFLDVLNICSFMIGLKNLEENLNQSDKQELIHDLNQKTDYLLNEINKHLEIQDEKIDKILEILKEVPVNGAIKG